MNKILGFTGTRLGMTQYQKKIFYQLAKEIDLKQFRHGDCIGSDKQAHTAIRRLKSKSIIVGHPPKYQKYRAFCKCDILTKPDNYLERNKAIVDNSDILIATPNGKEKLRSGTWSTIRYARKKQKPIYIIFPNGNVKKENV